MGDAAKLRFDTFFFWERDEVSAVVDIPADDTRSDVHCAGTGRERPGPSISGGQRLWESADVLLHPASLPDSHSCLRIRCMAGRQRKLSRSRYRELPEMVWNWSSRRVSRVGNRGGASLLA